MPNNRGKAFEAKFKTDFQKSFPEGTIDRIYDVTSGHKTVSNICDFLGYNYPNIFYLECKSHLGNTFPLANLTQYDKLKDKVGIKGVRVGVILWICNYIIVYMIILLYIERVILTQIIKEGGLKNKCCSTFN